MINIIFFSMLGSYYWSYQKCNGSQKGVGENATWRQVTNFGNAVGIFNASQPLQIWFSFSKDWTIFSPKKGKKK